ncbi:MAG: metallophosphoesterase, partial [Pseudomonadota bacterium]
MTTIVQLTDTHITPGGAPLFGQIDTAAAMARAVAHINALPETIGPIDAVVLTGDLVNDGMAAEYEAFRTIAQGLTPPLLAIPGNHDDRAAFRAGVGLMLAVAP